MKQRYLDHIDLRVRNVARARDFYARILPVLGFTCDRSDSEWATFYAAGGDRPEAFFGFTADPQHQPNGTRIAFWADSRAEVDRFAEIAREAGARNLEGPELCTEYSPGYYAFFFEDLDGNKLEICHREQPVVSQ
jgi:catechol 2,3-dioxygenase-like lactoylglutathione lyase family enzyme